MSAPYTLKTENVFTSRNDPEDKRLGDFCKFLEIKNLSDIKAVNKKRTVALWGNPDDQGISMNGGRPGAALAPNQIRKSFYKMTPPFNSENLEIIDFGNLDQSKQLSAKHHEAQAIATAAGQNSISWIALGGGHDYGYPDAAGFLEGLKLKNKSPKKTKSSKKEKNLKPVIINFDAHLDVRPTNKGHHSGTPFRRLLEKYKNEFIFLEVGIQPQCNSPHHKKWAIEQKTKIIDYFDIQNKGLLKSLKEELKKYKNHPCFISLDMDVFSSDVAPGCSQSWAYGLEQKEFFESFRWLLNHLDIQAMGIYEVSPPLDHDDRTSKLAALIMYHFLFLR